MMFPAKKEKRYFPRGRRKKELHHERNFLSLQKGKVLTNRFRKRGERKEPTTTRNTLEKGGSGFP